MTVGKLYDMLQECLSEKRLNRESLVFVVDPFDGDLTAIGYITVDRDNDLIIGT